MLPRWVLGILSLREYSAGRSERLSAWCERTLCQYVSPQDRAEVTVAIYQKQTMYKRGQPFFSRGLFDWEKKLFTREEFPRQGNILVTAAGGGREVQWFIERGYQVTGFDPASAFVSSWNLSNPHNQMLQASYQDLYREDFLSGQSFDAIVLGWGSLSHLLEEEQRRSLLRSLRARYPTSPVALSFLTSCDKDATRAPGKEPIYFLPWAGFICLLGRISLQKLADACGYRIVFYSDEIYSHALLCPQ
jgi:hypothetical protein